MPNPIDLSGQRFGYLTALSVVRSHSGDRQWLCLCECGKTKAILPIKLRKGLTKSCGCKQHSVRHGGAVRGHEAPEYWVWHSMLARCFNPKTKGYANYGGRGISVCPRWKTFDAFIADMGPRPGPHLTLERVNNDKGYEPDNCVWATRSEQLRNRRPYTHKAQRESRAA